MPVLSKFPILSLPTVALKNVLIQMFPLEILELSLVSKKANLCIKNCSIKIKKIIFRFHSITLTNHTYVMKLLRLSFDSKAEQNLNSRLINGSRFLNWQRDFKDFMRIICTPSRFEEDKLVAFHYLNDLFQFDEIDYEVSGYTDEFINNVMRKLPKTVGSLHIGNYSLFNDTDDNTRRTEEQVKTILDYCDVKVGLELHYPVSRLPEQMHNLNHVTLYYAIKLSVEELLKLNCKYIRIWNHQLTSEDVGILIQHWKTNNTRLETMLIGKDGGFGNSFDLKAILKGMNGKPWDSKRRDGKVKHENGVADYRKYIDIERDSDGLLASVGFKDRHFEFIVWKRPFQ